jgi:trimeric autotransporter adhesin
VFDSLSTVTFKLVATLFVAAALAGCGGSTTSAPSATVTAVTMTGAASLSGVGQTSQMTLTATTSSGAVQTVTSQATWQSSNAAVVTVSAGGLVAAQGFGAALVTASYQGATTSVAFVVTIAGTWVANASGGSSVTWVLTQLQGIVTGTFAVAPVAAGNSVSPAIVTGTISGSTLAWTMTGVIAADSGHPECVGTTPIIQGVAQVASGGGSMTATIQATTGVCDPNLVPDVPVGSAITFMKQ